MHILLSETYDTQTEKGRLLSLMKGEFACNYDYPFKNFRYKMNLTDHQDQKTVS